MTAYGTRQPEMVEIDLSQTTRKGGAGLEAGPLYLVLYSGRFHAGRFSVIWYGLSFNAGAFTIQYDPPGENSSSWQRVWRIENDAAITAEAEPEYARSCRRHAIDFHCRYNGHVITEDAPLEMFGYDPKVPLGSVWANAEEDE